MIVNSSMLRIPEFTLLEAIQKGLEFVKKDYELATTTVGFTEQDSYLYKVLSNIAVERYELYTQGKKVFLADEDDPRKLKVDLMYNMDVDSVPSIYITLPSEQNGQNGMGLDEGYQENIWNDERQTTVPIFTRRLNTTYSVMIVSDNSNEVIMIYHFLRALLISLHSHLNLMGIENIALGGQDVQLNSDLIPKHLFMRAITLNIQYETSAPDLREVPMISGLLFQGIATGKKFENDTPDDSNDL